MANNYIPLSQVVNDFVITLDGDDYVSNASDNTIRSFALRGVREMGFDLLKVVRSLKLPVSSNNTVEFPDDYIDWTKVGVVGSDGLVYVLGENKNLNYSQEYVVDGSGNRVDQNGDGVTDRVDSKTATNSGSPSVGSSISDGMGSHIFRNFIHNNNQGSLYGMGGGKYYGEFRVNPDQNRIEIESNSSISEVVIEYVADEARSINPRVHVYAEEALRSFIYYKMVERKSSVPANEKARARQEYYNERRKANSRMKSFTKEELLKTIRKNFKQAPKR